MNRSSQDEVSTIPQRPTAPRADLDRVLVIKLGALGDFVQSLGVARLIREYHVGARVTLLTTEPFETLAKACPYFDLVEADGRPSEPARAAQLVSRMRSARFDMVYDFQTNDRSSFYFQAMRPWPPLWSGISPGCSYPHANPEREHMHTLDRLADQLRFAGYPEELIDPHPLPDLSWIRRALRDPPRLQPEFFNIKPPYVLIAPGASGHRPEKRWPAEKFAELAGRIASRGITPVIIGSADEREIGGLIGARERRAKVIVSRTDLFQLAALAERAAGCVGNDTGPMHLAAAAGAPSVVLFDTRVSDSDRVAPRGRGGVLSLVSPDLAAVDPAEVDRALGNVGAYVAAKTP